MMIYTTKKNKNIYPMKIIFFNNSILFLFENFKIIDIGEIILTNFYEKFYDKK